MAQNFNVYNNMYFRTNEGKVGYIKADGENISVHVLSFLGIVIALIKIVS